MNLQEYLHYHTSGDASVEERLAANLTKELGFDEWGTFCFIYIYCTCYHLPSVIEWIKNPSIPEDDLTFRTDRRYVRATGSYKRMLSELTRDKMETLKEIDSSSEAYKYVSSWFFFGRYSAFLFLEVYYNRYPERLKKMDLKLGWEKAENYTKGAQMICGSGKREDLDRLIEDLKRETGDNEFVIETSLCAAWKIEKHKLNLYYCRERLFDLYGTSKYASLFFNLMD